VINRLPKTLDQRAQSCYTASMTEQQPWHSDAFLQNRYTRAYRHLIERVLTENRRRVIGEHAEHHIVPKSFYRSYCEDGWLDGEWDAVENRVLLTHREHTWCHILLALRMTTALGKRKMSSPLLLVLNYEQSRSSRVLAAAWHSYATAHADRCRDPKFLALLSKVNTEAQNRPDVAEKKRIKAHQRNDDPVFKAKHALAVTVAMNRPEVREANSTRAKERMKDPNFALAHAERMRNIALAPSGVQDRSRDQKVYTFTHEDGRTFTGTRWQMEDTYVLSRGLLRPLFKTNASKTCHGWTIQPNNKGVQNDPIC